MLKLEDDDTHKSLIVGVKFWVSLVNADTMYNFILQIIGATFW